MRRINIEAMAYKGYGMGRLDGKVVFVPYTVTGDEAWIEIVEDRKNFSEGRLREILMPSPWRIKPPCPSFGDCGGCHWQHIDPSVHQALKKEILRESLQRIGWLEEIPPLFSIPTPEPYGYRTRIQLKVDHHRIGFYAERSHRIVEIDRCLIAHPLINAILQILQEERRIVDPIQEIDVNVSPDEGKGVLILHSNRKEGKKNLPLKELVSSHPLLKGMALVNQKKSTHWGDPTLKMTTPLFEQGKEKVFHFRASPGSFYQVNPAQNLELIQAVLRLAALKGKERVLDLYAGIGNLTLPLAWEAGSAMGVEENANAVEDARFNAEANGIQNCQFLSGRVEEVLKRIEKGEDLLVLDPPRTGCKEVVPYILKRGPKKVIYVACDPTTFARDIRLLAGGGYVLQNLCLIDMFPQTYHMEVVGLLAKTEEGDEVT